MSVSLVKGQKVELTKGNNGLKKVVIGLGWDINRYSGEDAFDLDVSAFFIGADGKVTNDGDFIFYNLRREKRLIFTETMCQMLVYVF